MVALREKKTFRCGSEVNKIAPSITIVTVPLVNACRPGTHAPRELNINFETCPHFQ